MLTAGALLFIYYYYEFKLSGFSSKINLLFGILITLWLVSCILAPLPSWAFLQIGWYLLVGQLALLFARLYQQNKTYFIKLFMIALVVTVGVYVLQVFAHTISSYLLEYHPIWPNSTGFTLALDGTRVRPGGFINFSNVRFFNHLQTWSLPLLVFGYLYFKEKLIPGFQYLLLFLISAWWMLVFASDARGTMVACFFSLLFVFLLYRKKAYQFIKTYAFTVFGGLVLYLIFFILPSSPEAEVILTRYGTSGRIEVWLFAIQQIIVHPLVGLGPMHFSYIPLGASLSTPHNLLLQSMTEWGVPAAALAAGMVLYGGYRFIRQSLNLTKENSSPRFLNMRIALIASITAVAIHSMVSGILNTPFSQLMAVIVIGWVLGEYFSQSEKPLFVKRQKFSFRTGTIAVLLLANTVFIAVKVANDIPHLNERVAQYLKVKDSNKLYPRFWIQGKIGLEKAKMKSEP